MDSESFCTPFSPRCKCFSQVSSSPYSLTHGFYTAKKKVSATSVYFESLPYEVHHVSQIPCKALVKQNVLYPMSSLVRLAHPLNSLYFHRTLA